MRTEPYKPHKRNETPAETDGWEQKLEPYLKAAASQSSFCEGPTILINMMMQRRQGRFISDWSQDGRMVISLRLLLLRLPRSCLLLLTVVSTPVLLICSVWLTTRLRLSSSTTCLVRVKAGVIVTVASRILVGLRESLGKVRPECQCVQREKVTLDLTMLGYAAPAGAAGGGGMVVPPSVALSLPHEHLIGRP